MWILPKSLILAFAQDTEALTSDSGECSQTCAQSLMRRSKPSPAKTYLREWKAGNLMRLRSGAISSHFLGQSFLGWWTSSLEATRVSHLVQQDSEKEQTTQDIFGPTSQAAFAFFDQSSVSSRTSKDTLALDSEKSLENWKNLVTKRRGEYSARLNAVRLTSEKEYLSWPTCAARDWKDTITGTDPPSCPLLGQQTLGQAVSVMSGQAAQGNHSTLGSRPESWATPRAGCPGSRAPGTGGKVLEEQVKQPKAWATPRCSMAQDKQEDSGKHRLGEQVQHNTTGKLNPRWVETLMGLPVGWTMPSCASPVTIAPTSCASLETE